MKRTTIYLEPELEILLKIEMQRAGRPMAEIVRDAIRVYLTREPRQAPPGAGEFASGQTDTAERADAVLRETGFGTSTRPAPSATRTKGARRP